MTSPMHNMIVRTIQGSINIFFRIKIPAKSKDDINIVISRLMMTMICTTALGKKSMMIVCILMSFVRIMIRANMAITIP